MSPLCIWMCVVVGRVLAGQVAFDQQEPRHLLARDKGFDDNLDATFCTKFLTKDDTLQGANRGQYVDFDTALKVNNANPKLDVEALGLNTWNDKIGTYNLHNGGRTASKDNHGTENDNDGNLELGIENSVTGVDNKEEAYGKNRNGKFGTQYTGRVGGTQTVTADTRAFDTSVQDARLSGTRRLESESATGAVFSGIVQDQGHNNNRWRTKLTEDCEAFLASMSAAHTGIKSALNFWLQEAATLRDAAQTNCQRGADEEQRRKNARKTAKDVFVEKKGLLIEKENALETAQSTWCSSRNKELETLKAGYRAMDDDEHDGGGVTTPTWSDISQSVRPWFVKTSGRHWNVLCDVLGVCQGNPVGSVRVPKQKTLDGNVVAGLSTDMNTAGGQGTWLEGDGLSNGYQDVQCSKVAGVLPNKDGNTKGRMTATQRDAIWSTICDEGKNGNTNGMNAWDTREERVWSCGTDANPKSGTYSHGQLDQWRKRFISQAETVLSATGTYEAGVTTAETNLNTQADTEELHHRNMESALNDFLSAYYEFAYARHETNRVNQELLQASLAAEIVALAYSNFQDTVAKHETLTQQDYSESEKDLYKALMISFEMPQNFVGVDTVAMQQASVMRSTSDKWFGLAQLNLEALIASQAVTDACAAAGLGTFTPKITKFYSTDISGTHQVCDALTAAKTQILKVKAQRKAVVAVLVAIKNGEQQPLDDAKAALTLDLGN